MSERLDPRFDVLIDQLADQVQECLEGNSTLAEADVAPTVERLRDAGFADRKEGRPLWALLEDRVVDKYPEPAIHRKAELQSLISTVRDAWVERTDLKDPSIDRR